MENSMTGILIEAVARAALHKVKADPERGIRYMVDLALLFSGSPAQRRFFEAVQSILANEDGPYHGMVRELIAGTDADRLLRFGMDLGYHGCICAARRIREGEQRLGCRIPWTVLLKTDASFPERFGPYDAAVTGGEKLGIHTWMLFASAATESTLALAGSHPDSAFFLFCTPRDAPPRLLDDLAKLENLMPVLRLREEDSAAVCAALRDAGIPFSLYSMYGEEELPDILSGDLLADAAHQGPVFTVLLPRSGCPGAARRQVQQAVERARTGQMFATIPWELEADNARVQQIIDGTTISVRFDPEGSLLGRDGRAVFPRVSLFSDGLAPALEAAFTKSVPQGIA